MFIGIPTHFWVLPVAGLITYFGLKWADQSSNRATMLCAVTYLLLVALAVLPNGFYALFPPSPNMPELIVSHQPLPSYEGRFYLDAFYVFSGWALSKVAKLKFN
ncbi:hypothetical protein [Pseudomonas sp. TWI929]|uniref:hypothetical protein n=1 Tax=Pseudomonas sp. TWI929 TaxID=3136795 RepID=UPI00320B73B0